MNTKTWVWVALWAGFFLASCKTPSGEKPDVSRPAEVVEAPAEVTEGVNVPDKGETCGNKICPQGQVCCNASCGICTPPDGLCIQMMCEDEVVGLDDQRGSHKCAADSECRLQSDYCTGCDCRALTIAEDLPACAGPGVRCLRDPCDDKVAKCVNGACVAATKPVAKR